MMMREFCTLGVVLLTCSCGGQAQEQSATAAFAQKVHDLSEPGGFFDTDNLISNERSYLHVMNALAREGVSDGAYIGVGPDQNFSYIAQIDPAVAYIIDIRRDNMVLHLMFKAMFELASTRVEFLSLLLGRSAPANLGDWSEWSLDEIVVYFDTVSVDRGSARTAREVIDSAVATFGVDLSEAEWANLDRFHRTFIDAGLSLRFSSYGRSPRSYYPTYRDLILERDASGSRANYLATHERYEVVRSLQIHDRVIPVVGDVAGSHALRAIGQDVEMRGLVVSTFYISNVEFYLFGSGTFSDFVRNVRGLPIGARSMMIRSVFRNPYGTHPLTVAGYASTQMLQRIDDLLVGHSSGEIRSYRSLVGRYLPN